MRCDAVNVLDINPNGTFKPKFIHNACVYWRSTGGTRSMLCPSHTHNMLRGYLGAAWVSSIASDWLDADGFRYATTTRIGFCDFPIDVCSSGEAAVRDSDTQTSVRHNYTKYEWSFRGRRQAVPLNKTPGYSDIPPVLCDSHWYAHNRQYINDRRTIHRIHSH